MSAKQSKDRIQASIWKAIAKSEIDLTSVSKEDLDDLVNIVADAAILELDDEINESESSDEAAVKQYYPTDDDDEEQVLWKGRPILSISDHYLITNERVRLIHGILGKDRQDIELIRIQDVDITQTIRERALNVGDLIINSHDRSAPTVVLNNIRNPETTHQLLRRAIQDARNKHNITFQEEM
jgi:hypothetical protein